jgi:hypothetical protein
MDNASEDILFKIIYYQNLFGDYNSAIFSKKYYKAYLKYIEKKTNWNVNTS